MAHKDQESRDGRIRRRALWWISPHPDVAYQIHVPIFHAPVGIMLATAFLTALLALQLAIPGHEILVAAFLLVALLIAVAASSVLFMPTDNAPAIEQFVAARAPCTVSTFAIVAVACFALLLPALRQGAPLAPVTAEALAGTVAMFLAASAGPVLRPSDEPRHTLRWHLLPVVIGLAISGRVALATLPRWQRG